MENGTIRVERIRLQSAIYGYFIAAEKRDIRILVPKTIPEDHETDMDYALRGILILSLQQVAPELSTFKCGKFRGKKQILATYENGRDKGMVCSKAIFSSQQGEDHFDLFALVARREMRSGETALLFPLPTFPTEEEKIFELLLELERRAAPILLREDWGKYQSPHRD